MCVSFILVYVTYEEKELFETKNMMNRKKMDNICWKQCVSICTCWTTEKNSHSNTQNLYILWMDDSSDDSISQKKLC